VSLKEMKISTIGNLRSVFIDSKEIKYIRIDNKNNVVVILENPVKVRKKTVTGYRGKLIDDPTGSQTILDSINYIFQEEMNYEDRIVKEGILILMSLPICSLQSVNKR
jgi:hypothetical protein